jgi:hypothetical protein
MLSRSLQEDPGQKQVLCILGTWTDSTDLQAQLHQYPGQKQALCIPGTLTDSTVVQE